MFAPPPLQLSRAEIQTRLEGEEKTTEGKDSSGKAFIKSFSVRRHATRSPTSPRRYFFSKGDKVQVSPPTAFGPYCISPERQHPSTESTNIVRADPERLIRLPEGFGENPRPAPTPPKRPAPVSVSSPHWTPPLPGAFPPPQDFLPEIPSGNATPPPIPPRSQRRRSTAKDDPEEAQNFDPISRAIIKPPTFLVSPEKLDENITATSEELLPWQQRTSMSPTFVNRKFMIATANRVPGRARSSTWINYGIHAPDQIFSQANGMNSRLPGATNSRIHKILTSKRPKRGRPHLATGIQFHETASRDVEPLRLLKGTERCQNEERDRSSNSIWSPAAAHAPHRLDFVDKPLPETPRSIMATPTEIYQSTQTSPLSRPRTHKWRSPLAQISPTQAKTNSPVISEDGVSPSRLSAIPEHTTSNDKSPFASGSSAAVATRMHLRGGSLLTVSPPELTPWQRIIYIQGPIKLPKPVIVPRKNSVASLEPFQEAIDQVYQDALNIPRRRSDDKILDDVCEFFDDFGFDEVNFEGDIFALEQMEVEDVTEIDFENGHERFSTPPGELTASPVEKRVAQNVVEMMTARLRLPNWQMQPAEKEDALKSRGIADLVNPATTKPAISPQRRKDSMTLSKFDTSMTPLLHLPKESVVNGLQEHFGFKATR